jgi:predicted nuclease of predicted toxin-antitoxin system
VALFKLKVVPSQKKFQTCAIRFNNLTHSKVKKAFKIKLQNRYEELQRVEDQNEEIEKIWNEAKSALIKANE